MNDRVKNPKSLRTNNKAAVAFRLLTKGDTSRLRLARELSLTGASITQLVRELMDEDVVSEVSSVRRNSTGRREVLLRYNDENFTAVGVNIESDRTHVSLCSYGEVISEEIVRTDSLGMERGDVSALAGIVNGMLSLRPGGREAVGVGVGIAGITDDCTGVSEDSHGILPKHFSLHSALRERVDADIFVINNVCAQARALIKDSEDYFLYVKHSPGLGCALVADGKLVEGFRNRAGEIGHTVVRKNGKVCACGKRGCLETVISERSIEESAFVLLGREAGIGEIYAMYGRDPAVTELLDDCARLTALAVGNAATLTDPRRVVLTGGMFFDAALRKSFETALDELGFSDGNSFEFLGKDVKIKAFAGARHVLLKKIFGV